LAIPGYEELIIERAIRRYVNGWAIWICTAEDLIIQKIVAGREKDLLDVESILVVQHDIMDYEYIEGWLSKFAEALEQLDLLNQYHALVDKASHIQSV
jgi:hypothetical protein